MFVSNKRIYFKFVVVVKRWNPVEKAIKAAFDRRLRKSNPVEKQLYLNYN